MSYELLVQQMTMITRLLATACFVCAQVKVEHPVMTNLQALTVYRASVSSTWRRLYDLILCMAQTVCKSYIIRYSRRL